MAAPPVTATNAEVVQQQHDIRRQALKKKGFSSTYLAGDTGGWNPANTAPAPGKPQNPSAGGPGAKLGT